MSAPEPKAWDTNYEFKIILLLSLAFGLVGLDRFILPVLFPSMAEELGLTLQDLGNLVGILAVAWGISAFAMGYLSDRLGRRKVLVPAVIIFSLMSALSGVATGLLSLLVIRAMMGAAEGPVASTGVAVAVEASHPKRRGMNNGIFQCMISLFGLALGPIIATQLLQYMSWHYVFMIVGIPGLILAGFMWFIIREPETTAAGAHGHHAPRPSFGDLFKHRNVTLAMLTLMCAMTGIFVLAAMMPVYLETYLKLTTQQMGFVTSAIGFGGFIGQFGIPTISDVIGRKPATLLSFVVAAIFLYLFIGTGAESLGVLFGLLFVAAMCNFGALAILAGPVAAEAAPVGMVASVAGLVIGAGEIFGGGIAPVIGGNLAQNYGIQYTLWFALGGQLLGILIALMLKETAPRKVGGMHPSGVRVGA
ncbi:MAG TPA: MFS transporter [Phenylobacterium sp.]|nr:MFS transporter [Phenylobacterium sp.]